MSSETPVRCKMRVRNDDETKEEWLEIDFSVLLHKRGSDWWVYKTNWDKVFQIDSASLLFSELDSELACRLVAALMEDNTGVSGVSVHKYTLSVYKSAAVDNQSIVDIVNRVGHELGLF